MWNQIYPYSNTLLIRLHSNIFSAVGGKGCGARQYIGNPTWPMTCVILPPWSASSIICFISHRFSLMSKYGFAHGIMLHAKSHLLWLSQNKTLLRILIYLAYRPFLWWGVWRWTGGRGRGCICTEVRWLTKRHQSHRLRPS